MNFSKITEVLFKLKHYKHNWTPSFSQEGEDLVLRRYFQNKTSGFYVDVGAHHPIRFSNTQYFYLKGWHGINIDASPQSIKVFNEVRTRDINVNVGVSSEESEADFYVFHEQALNTFSEQLKEQRIKQGYPLKEKIKIKLLPLAQILEKHIPQNTEIDILSIDVEGLDYEVITSNDWKKFRPKYVLVEALDSSSIRDVLQHKTVNFLEKQGYTFCSKTMNTLFFERQ